MNFLYFSSLYICFYNLMSSNSQSSSRVQPKTVFLGNQTPDPYELIRRLNKEVMILKGQIDEYSIAFNGLEQERNILKEEKQQLESVIENLQEKLTRAREDRNLAEVKNTQFKIIYQSGMKTIPEQIKRNLLTTPTHRKHQIGINRTGNDVVKSYLFQGRDTPAIAKKDELQNYSSAQLEEEFIPQPVRLNLKHKANSDINGTNLTAQGSLLEANWENHDYGEHLIEDLLIIGPEINEFKNRRHADRSRQQITVKSHWLLNMSKFYKQKKVQFLNEMAIRAFPEGCKLQKKLVDSGEEVTQIATYRPNPKLDQDYFIFTLKGDDSLLKGLAPGKNLLGVSNPNYFLYVVCLKVPEFIYVRDQKNYHRKESQIWVTEKIYAVATYYPFFSVFINLLSRIHSQQAQANAKRIIVGNQSPFMWNLTKNVYDFEKSQEAKEQIFYFMGRRPDYSQICYSGGYLGTLPEFGFRSQYPTSLFCASVFFSHFAYEEFLLLLTAIFCQKTLIFLSSSQTVATLSALFLINLIRPFQFSSPLLLNCDSQKVKQMVFEYPFAMVCSIKKTAQNLPDILYLFAESNVMRTVESDAQYIVVDIDSNTILYHNVLDELFNTCICSPGENIRKLYLELNSCESKSFSLPKMLPRQNYKPPNKHLSNIQRREEQKKKYVKSYLERIAANTTKIPRFNPPGPKHEQLIKALSEYIQSFSLGEDAYEIVYKVKQLSSGKNKQARNEVVRQYLLEKNKDKQNLINQFLQSQMYADYLDALLEIL